MLALASLSLNSRGLLNGVSPIFILRFNLLPFLKLKTL